MKDTTIPDGILRDMQDFYDKQLLQETELGLVHARLEEQCSAESDDPVNPAHYMLPDGLQVVDVEMAMFGRQAVMDHCMCTAVEYLLRHKQKNGLEDVKKASWWVQHYLKLAEEDAE